MINLYFQKAINKVEMSALKWSSIIFLRLKLYFYFIVDFVLKVTSSMM